MIIPVALVGAGPGDPGLLTVKAARLIAQAEVLVYDALASEPIVDLASPQCRKIYAGKRARNHTMPQEEISAVLIREARAGRRVVRLKGGDPFVFGRGGEEAQELRAAGIPFEIVPGISSALAAPAYAGIPVTHRTVNTSFTVATGHEDPAKGVSTLDWARLADGHGTAVFLMAMGNLPGIVRQLQHFGRPPRTPVAVIQDGTTPGQRTLTATLETVVAEVERHGIGAPAIVVVGEAVALREDIRWFDRHPLFGQRVLITRPLEEGRVFGSELWGYGARPVYAPLITYTEPSDAAARDVFYEELMRGDAPEWLVFTSRAGVRAFVGGLHARERDLRVLGGTSVAAIGPGTTEALAAAGLHADLVPDEHYSEALADALLERIGAHTGRIVIWSAQEGRDHLERRLAAAGHAVVRIAAYHTVAAAVADLAERAAESTIWTFASGSAVHNFCAALSDAPLRQEGRRVVCLGPVTAAAAQGAGLRVDGIARQATVAAFLDAAAELFSAPAAVEETSLHAMPQ